jgi:hypothetical protein
MRRSLSSSTSAGCLAALLLAICACAPTPRQRAVKEGPVESGAGTLTAARKYLEGVWTLVSFEIFPMGQPPIHLQGTGTLTYDAYGNLTMSLYVDEATVRLAERAGIHVNQGEIQQTGRTVVDLEARTLTYVMEGQAPLVDRSSPFSLDRPRHWSVNGDVLTLTTMGDDGRTASVGRWKKTTPGPDRRVAVECHEPSRAHRCESPRGRVDPAGVLLDGLSACRGDSSSRSSWRGRWPDQRSRRTNTRASSFGPAASSLT